jgi:SAM-dependent methyltransferase
MSIFPSLVHLLKCEHLHRPIEHELLLIGRQRVEYSELTDVQLFATFSLARVRALDVSPYEGAEIVHDLCKPLPDSLRASADFIFDGSCLDNIHDPTQALRSMSAILRPGGRIMLFEHGTAIQGALVTFSPEWFFDFFAANNYADCQIKLGCFSSIMTEPWVLLDWAPFDDAGKPVSATPSVGDFVTIVLAEKGHDSTDDISPVQAQYRVMHGQASDKYLAAHERYRASKRRGWHATVA